MATASGTEHAGAAWGPVGNVAAGDAGHVCPHSVNFLSLAPGTGSVLLLPSCLAVPEPQARPAHPDPALRARHPQQLSRLFWSPTAIPSALMPLRLQYPSPSSLR